MTEAWMEPFLAPLRRQRLIDRAVAECAFETAQATGRNTFAVLHQWAAADGVLPLWSQRCAIRAKFRQLQQDKLNGTQR